MPNYFYNDKTGKRQGPINDQQLQVLAFQGLITPDTLLETETGYRGRASQISGLKFSVQTTFTLSTNSVRSEQAPSKPWLKDFTFQNKWTRENNLWACRNIYRATYWVSLVFGILGSLTALGFGIGSLDNYGPGWFLLSIIEVAFLLWAVWTFLFLLRFALELEIIFFDWVLEATKTSRIYNKEKLGREE